MVLLPPKRCRLNHHPTSSAYGQEGVAKVGLERSKKKGLRKKKV
jgi:hypothetical protein